MSCTLFLFNKLSKQGSANGDDYDAGVSGKGFLAPGNGKGN